MNKITKKWLEFSKEDLKNAEILFNNKSYKGSIYHCHQAIEKFIKAVVNAKGKRIPKTHDLPYLLKESALKLPESVVQIIEELSPYYNPSRYPDVFLGISLKYDRKTALQFLKQTKEIIKWLRNELMRLK